MICWREGARRDSKNLESLYPPTPPPPLPPSLPPHVPISAGLAKERGDLEPDTGLLHRAVHGIAHLERECAESSEESSQARRTVKCIQSTGGLRTDHIIVTNSSFELEICSN